MDKEIVTITGISGYVGSQVCLHYLNDGTYKVRGTVRSKTNDAKIQPLKDAFGEKFDEIELVEADLLDEESMKKAIEGSTYVVHTASPFPIIEPKDEQTLIKPAVDGTLAVCRACQASKVKRLVITSSVASIMESADKDKTEFTVEDWSAPEICNAYHKSKTLAERAAWDFQAALPEDEKYEIVVINPGLVLGPNLNKAQFSSGDIVRQIMMKELPGLPKVQLPMVDVRNVAQAHLMAIKVPEAANKRFMLVSESCFFSKLGEDLDEIYGQKGSKKYPVVKKELPKMLCYILAWFNKEIAGVMPYWGVVKTFKNTETTEVLKIDFIPVKQSVQEMAVTLIDCGYIPDKR